MAKIFFYLFLAVFKTVSAVEAKKVFIFSHYPTAVTYELLSKNTTSKKMTWTLVKLVNGKKAEKEISPSKANYLQNSMYSKSWENNYRSTSSEKKKCDVVMDFSLPLKQEKSIICKGEIKKYYSSLFLLKALEKEIP